MTEQPKPTEASDRSLHIKAVKLVHKWMNNWEVIPAVPVNPTSVAAFHDLFDRFFKMFQQDEQIRADLLAACEALMQLRDSCFGPDEPGVPEWVTLRAAIAKAKETNHVDQ
jgi:hypothetical protein